MKRRNLMTVLLAISTFTAAVLATEEAKSSGGSLVGNGGGLAEQNVAFAYHLLPKVIDSCLHTKVCGLAPRDEALLSRIKSILLVNASRKDKFVFLSAASNPGFFDTGKNEHHRVAKTGSTPNTPIYFNTDIIAGANSQRVLSVAEAAAILVHEVGHQTGEMDHQSLDDLGAKIRFRFDNHVGQHPIPDLTPQVSMQVFNYDGMFFLSDLVFTYGNQIKNVTPLMIQNLNCRNPKSILTGFRLDNGHWVRPVVTAQEITLVFQGWATIYCASESSQLEVETSDTAITIRLHLAPDSQATWEMQSFRTLLRR
jgi:hypothetical protein